MLGCKISAKARFHGRGRRSLTCSAHEYCASGAKSVHAPGAGLLGEAPDTGLEAGAGLAAGVTGGLAAGVGLVEGLVVEVGLVEGVVLGVGLMGGEVPGGQRLQVAAQ